MGDSRKSSGDAEGRAEAKSRARAYQAAIEALFALLIGIGIGYWADEYWGTSPRWIFVGMALGFGAMILRITRMRSMLETGEGTKPLWDDDEERED